MDIQDYIAGLPVAVDGPTGRLGNHAVVHAGLQDHEERLASKADAVSTQNNFGDTVSLLAGWTADMRGGRNLLLNSSANITTTEYLVARLDLAPNHGLVEGDEFTISIKGLLGADRSHFVVYNSSAVLIATSLYPTHQDSDGVYRVTSKWKVGSTSNNYINIYAFSSASVSPTTIEWVKIEKGGKATPWTPAPEDLGLEIKESGLNQTLANPLIPVDTTLDLRLDTTVGTRIFAGDTMIHGDTGWRNVAPLVEPGLLVSEGVSGGFHFRTRRYGNQVFWSIRFKPDLSFVGTANTIHVLPGTVPSGFKELPATFGSFAAGMRFNSNMISFSNEPGGTRLAIYTNSSWSDAAYGLTGGYITNDAWPTTLPGLPA